MDSSLLPDYYGELLMDIDHFLVESGGELPLVVLRLPASQVDVSRADLVQRAWVKLNSLGDRSLFIGDGCCFSLSAAVTGDGGDHIYLAKPADTLNHGAAANGRPAQFRKQLKMVMLHGSLGVHGDVNEL